jgi:hypothetical protein
MGIDAHKESHTVVAVDGATGGGIDQVAVPARRAGRVRRLTWARGLGGPVRLGVEDCRHLPGGLERSLVGRGEGLCRVAPALMGQARRAQRGQGTSDPIDAPAVARAALADPGLPEARLAGAERQIRPLVDHREDLVGERTGACQRLRWRLHDLDPTIAVPAGGLARVGRPM